MRTLLLSLVVILVFTGCYDEPDYPLTPRLTGIDVYFKDMPSLSDSLVIRVDFEDGDGDLGLYTDENQVFGPFEPQLDPSTGEFLVYDSENPDPRLPPYDCRTYLDFDPTPLDTVDDRDTILVEYNEEYYNFSITLYQLIDGQYEEYDLRSPPLCSAPLGGRFIPLKDDFDNKKPLKGTIQYGTESALFSTLFINDTLKIDVAIRDRAGNMSNVISKEGFTLREVEIPVQQ